MLREMGDDVDERFEGSERGWRFVGEWKGIEEVVLIAWLAVQVARRCRWRVVVERGSRRRGKGKDCGRCRIWRLL